MKHVRSLLPYVPYLVLSLLVLGPLLLPGFVLTMDMVFTPVLRMPDHVDNTWLFYALLHVLNFVLPADVIEKTMLLAALMLSGIGAHRILRLLRPSGEKYVTLAIYIASAFYMINPFVYDRFMSGQYGVVLGYSLLPWFAVSLKKFVHQPGWRSVLPLTGWTIAMSIVSIHSLGWVAILALCALAMYARDRRRLQNILKFGAAGLIIFAIMGAYWILPTVVGQGRIANSLSTFSGSERQAFATVDPNGTTELGAVLGLQGFWQETVGLFIVPIDATPQWGWVQVLLLVTIGCGVWRAWKSQRRLALYATSVSTIAIFLSLGIGGEWLATHVPFFAGFREPQKFVAIIALMYVYFMMEGVSWLLARTVLWRKLTLYPAAAAALLMVLAYTSPMLWGFYGQIQPVRYPDDWSAMNRVLNQQPNSGTVLFLPWHLYMSFNFSGRIIANPAANFFDRAIVSSDDPEVAGVAPQTRNPTRERIQQTILPAAARGEPVMDQLRALGIGYVLLDKDLNWRDYTWLDHQSGSELVQETTSLKLYKLTNDTIGLHEDN